jgi:uncharacterized protein YlxW (UPF0749 family)
MTVAELSHKVEPFVTVTVAKLKRVSQLVYDCLTPVSKAVASRGPDLSMYISDLEVKYAKLQDRVSNLEAQLAEARSGHF